MGRILSMFQSRDAGAPAVAAWGFVELANLRNVAAKVLCSVGLDPNSEAEMWIEGRSAHQGGRAICVVQMFALPAADAAFAEALKSNGTHRQWPLPGGATFEPTMLLPRHLPAGWRHSAVQTQTPGGLGIKHAWRGGGRGLIVRLMLDRGDVLSEPLFKWAADNLRVGVNAWRVDPQVPPTSRDDDDELSGPDDMGGGPRAARDAYVDDEIDPDSRGGGAGSDRSLDEGEQDDLFANVLRGGDYLKLPDDAPAAEALKALKAEVHRQRPSFASLKPNVRHNMSVALGSVWGHLLTKEAGWEWCALSRDGAEFLAVVSPDRACAISPVGFIGQQLAGDGDDTVVLLFNMIRAGKLPKAAPGEYRMLS